MKESLEDIKKELQKDQQNPKTLQSLGSYYLNKSLYKQARDEHALASSLSPHVIADIMIAYEKFIAKSPKDIQARLALASFCISNKDFDSAALELEELLEIDKQNIQGYNILGKLYIAQNKIDESILLLEKAYKEGIKDVLISETLAAVYLEKGRNQEAIKFYEELPQSKKNLPRSIKLCRKLLLRCIKRRVRKLKSKAEKRKAKTTSLTRITKLKNKLFDFFLFFIIIIARFM